MRNQVSYHANWQAVDNDQSSSDVRGLGAEAQPLHRARSTQRAEPGSVQSVERAIMLLELLSRSAGGTSLTDLSSQAGLNISTSHHLLATLVKLGYVAQVPGRRTYALGARVLGLGQSYMRQVDLPRRAQPVLDRLTAVTGEAVHLAVLQGDRVVTVAKSEGRQAVRVDTGEIGATEAPHATATGKAMLAWLPEDQMSRLLAAGGMTRFTPSTIVDIAVLVEELRLVRRNGFAMDREEQQPGVVGVGAAVRDHTGAVIGALSASAPAFRAGEEQIVRLREAVIEAARLLSAEFGAPAPPAADSPRHST
jgi:IclR family acetate operon transcriptional repressor